MGIKHVRVFMNTFIRLDIHLTVVHSMHD